MTLPPRLATLGRIIESRSRRRSTAARRSSRCRNRRKQELVDDLGFRADAGSRSSRRASTRASRPAARSADAARGRGRPARAREAVRHPGRCPRRAGAPSRSRVGDRRRGVRRDQLEAQIHAAGAEAGSRLPGRVDDEEVVDLYRRAWVLASASAREGWGMTITEAAACGTPAVATRIAGHADAVVEGAPGCSPTARRARRCARPVLGDAGFARGSARPRSSTPALHLGGNGARHPRSPRAGRHPSPRPTVSTTLAGPISSISTLTLTPSAWPAQCTSRPDASHPDQAR